MNIETSLVGGRYHLQSALGSGGIGVVYRAYDPLTDSLVALKQIRSQASSLAFASKSNDKDASAALVREFQTLATLRHPNIIPVLDFGFRGDSQPYYTMTLLEQPQQIDMVARERDVQGKVLLLVDILQALIYLHRRGILHRDLKPGNVLVDTNGQVRVLDFGLSVERELAQGFVGTLAYMAPEIITTEIATITTDLYSVGVMAYECFAGCHPFKTDSIHTLIRQMFDLSPDLDKLDAPPSIQRVIGRLLAKDPAARYPDAQSALLALCDAAQITLPEESVVIRNSFLRSAKFIGRQHEMAQLVAALREAKQGMGSGWLLTGESGIGKSRLVEEVAIQALVQGFRVLRVQVRTARGNLPQALCNALPALLLTTPVTELEASVLKPLIPQIDTVLGYAIPDAPELDSDANQQRLLQTIEEIFARQSEPLLVILEDLQWAGDSVRMLRALYKLASTLPLVMIGAYRNDETPYLYGKFPADTALLELQRLTHDEVEDLAVSMLGEAGRNPAVVEFIERQSEGNVFFMIDLIEALMENAERLEDIGRINLPMQLVSQGLLDSAQRRLHRVPSAYHPMLRLAAVIGRRIDFALLEAVDNTLDYDDWLVACVNASIFDIEDGRWRFAHDTIRDGLLLDTDAESLTALHRIAAEAVETVYADRADHDYAAALAHHWRGAGDAEREKRYAYLAGLHLCKQGSLAEAEDHLRRANALFNQQDAAVLDALVWVLQHRGKIWEACEAALKLLMLTMDDRTWKLRGLIRYISALNYGVAPDWNAAWLVQEGLQLAGTTTAREQAARMYAAAARWYMTSQQDIDTARNFYARALRLEKTPHLLVGLHNDIALLLMIAEDWTSAESTLRYAIRQAVEIGDLVRQSSCQVNLCLVLLRQHRYAELYEAAQFSMELARQTGAALEFANDAAMLAAACLQLGKVDEASQHFEDAIDSILALGNPLHQAVVLGFTAHGYLHHGKALRAAQCLHAAKTHSMMPAFIYNIAFGAFERELQQMFTPNEWDELAQTPFGDLQAQLNAARYDLTSRRG